MTTIFLPLILPAGIYGPNTRHERELGRGCGHCGLPATMAVIAMGMAAWVRRRGWT